MLKQGRNCAYVISSQAQWSRCAGNLLPGWYKDGPIRTLPHHCGRFFRLDHCSATTQQVFVLWTDMGYFISPRPLRTITVFFRYGLAVEAKRPTYLRIDPPPSPSPLTPASRTSPCSQRVSHERPRPFAPIPKSRTPPRLIHGSVENPHCGRI